MENAQTESTLREDLLSSFESVETGTTAVDAPVIEVAPASVPTDTETATEQAQRLRDEAGRFAKSDKPAAAPVVAKPAPVVAPVDAETAVIKKPRPSSWKKDFDPHWDAFAPEVQDYIQQRESEYARGVSTYKLEAESARAINEAMAPFLPTLQKHNVEPTQWIRNLGAAHDRLALGTPQEKVMMGAKLIQDYGIDPQQLFQVLSGQTPYQQPQMPQQQQPAQQPVDINAVVEQKLLEREINSEYQRFVTEAPEKYPHYEKVKDTMAGLLQAELAQDYASAYEAALRHPRHADLYEQAQLQRTQAEAAAKAVQAQGVATRARSQAVSVKSSTPSGTMAQQPKGTTSLRDDLATAFDAVTSSGRV